MPRVRILLLSGVVAASLIGCEAASVRRGLDIADAAAPVVDTVLGAVNPRLGRTEQAVDAMRQELDKLPPQDSLGWDQIAGLALTGVLTYFGVNYSRNRKYLKPPQGPQA